MHMLRLFTIWLWVWVSELYVLRMTLPGAAEVTVEPGKRRRPWTIDYGLDEGMVFVGPKGEHAALMVAQRQVMAEGVRTTWMANGVSLR